MKATIVIVVFLHSITANAYDAENIRAFLKKDKTCAFATYRVMKGKSTRNSFPQRFDVACIGDVKIGVGTIREKKGCAAFNFNVETGRIANLTTFGPNIADSKLCSDGGFEEVIGQLLYNDNSEAKPRKVLVKDFLSPYPQSIEPASFYRFVVYSEKESYRTKLGYGREEVDLKNLDVLNK